MRQAGRQAGRVMKRPSVRYSGNWLLGRRAAFSREIVCKTRPPTASHPLPANQSTETTGDTTMALALIVVTAEIQMAGLERHFSCVHRLVMICTVCVHSVVTICTACAQGVVKICTACVQGVVKTCTACVHSVVKICTACVRSVVTICTACVHTQTINFEHCPDEQPVCVCVCVCVCVSVCV